MAGGTYAPPLRVAPASRAAEFKARPLAFYEALRQEDEIALQDTLNTSRALADAAREGDLEELRAVVDNALEGDILQVFALQAFVSALKGCSLEMVREFVKWGIPLGHEQLSQSLHLVCEVTTRENFSNAWRIIELLKQGNGDGGMNLDTPRAADGWTPLCIACADACLPLTFKLLELEADPNVITRASETPLALARRKRDGDNEEQQEARGIIANMLCSYGAQAGWREALSKSRRQGQCAPRQPADAASEADTPSAARAPRQLTDALQVAIATGQDGIEVLQHTISSSHTRFSA